MPSLNVQQSELHIVNDSVPVFQQQVDLYNNFSLGL